EQGGALRPLTRELDRTPRRSRLTAPYLPRRPEVFPARMSAMEQGSGAIAATRERRAQGTRAGASFSEERPVRVLIVDDCADTCRWLSSLLRSEGYQEVQMAQSGQAALELLGLNEPGKEVGFDLVLTDLNMPGLD